MHCAGKRNGRDPDGDVILHSDLNCFYASVEMNENPELKGLKIAVCGSAENRHGIVLTASYPAKRCGVKTGMANWQAREVCCDLITVEPHYDLYLRYSKVVRNIYRRYTDTIEPFGMDECWLSLPAWGNPEDEGFRAAEEIRHAVKKETGLTVSVGVSFSKIFAKLGSDMKKPDAVTVISRENYRDTAWKLPVSDLLYCGPATTRKLRRCGIRTIGDLAAFDPRLIQAKLGKNGLMLRRFANGEDGCAVMPAGYAPPIKSVGHGATCIRDLNNCYEVWLVLYELAQDLGHRMRQYGITAKGVQISVRDCDLGWQQWQVKLPYASRSPLELTQAAFDLFRLQYRWEKPIRALTIRAISLLDGKTPVQTDLFNDYERRERRQRADDCIDTIRSRFGTDSIGPAALCVKPPVANDRCETVPMPSVMYR